MKTFCPISMLFMPVREKLVALSPSAAGEPGLVKRVKAFFRGLIDCPEERLHSAKNLVNPSLANLSSVTTPNGPWVYTIVPWED
jgi:hypothetical protein